MATFTRTAAQIEEIHNTVSDPSTNQAFTDAIGEEVIPKYTEVVYSSVADMIAGNPATTTLNRLCKVGLTSYKRVAINGNIDDFDAVNSKVGSSDYIVSAAERDAYYVGRELKGLTDCHAFTDRTVISEVTDSGTYGTFDSVTKVEGNHNQSHQFSFQDRAIYAGTGAGEIGTWGNIFWPEKTGDGTVDKRYDFWVKDINNSGGGAVNTHIGIFMEDLNEANSNSALTSLQSTGYTLYAPNGGKVKVGGKIEADGGVNTIGSSVMSGPLYAGAGFKAGGLANGSSPISGVSVTLDMDGNPFQAFASVNSIGAAFGVIGDNSIQFITDGVTRFTCGDSSKGYDFAPTSSSQNLGNPAFLWKELFCINPTINTSDERLKTFIGSQSEAEKRVAIKLKNSLKSFKWNDSIQREESGGSKSRIHFGIGAQTLAKCFDSEGLNPNDYAMFCYDEWDDIYDDVCVNEGDIETGVEQVTRQKVEKKTQIKNVESFELIDGKYTHKTEEVREDIEVPVFESHLVYNDDGTQKFNIESHNDKKGNNVEVKKPLTHRVPVMETVDAAYSRPAERIIQRKLIKPSGNRYGVRLEQVNAFIIAAL